MNRRRAFIAFATLLALAAAQGAEPVRRLLPKLTEDAHTLFLLEADAAKGAFVDRTGRSTPTVTGGTVVADAQFGACLKLGGAGETGITVKDNGALRFAGGVTLDAWVRFDDAPPEKGALFAMKVGSFAWELQKGKLNTSWMVFPSEEIFTTSPQQFKYYPVGGETINGLMNVPVGKWVRLTAVATAPTLPA